MGVSSVRAKREFEDRRQARKWGWFLDFLSLREFCRRKANLWIVFSYVLGTGSIVDAH